MKNKNTMTVRALLAVAVLGLAMALPNAQAQRNRNPGIMPPQSSPNGMSYGAWAAAWWQWAFIEPQSNSPLYDDTGEKAALGQEGPVWFLAGTMAANYTGPITRTVTVPTGKALFFPIVNNCWINLPELGDDEWSPEQEAFARGVIAEAIDLAEVACEIDGRPVQNLENYRFQSPPFMVDIPADDIWGLDGYGLVPGTYGPAVDDGYYLMLAPLSKGNHTIHFTTLVPDVIELDVTYHLTIK